MCKSFFAALIFFLVAPSAANSLSLSTKSTNSGSGFSATIVPSQSAAGCVHTLYGAASPSRLRGSLRSALSIISIDGRPGRSVIKASSLSPLQKDGGNVRVYFLAKTVCGDTTTTSRVSSLSLSTVRSGGKATIPLWLNHLSERILRKRIALKESFPSLSFSLPVALVDAMDGSERLFVVEQGGTIKVFANSVSANSAATFLDLSSRISTDGERGLLSLVFDPQYSSNGFFYVFYTAADGTLTVSRFGVDPNNANQADAGSELVLLQIAHSRSNHNGGQLLFDDEGFLLFSSGDGGGGGDPDGNGQNLTTLLGKLLRIDVHNTSNGKNYAIPPNNPFAGNQSGYREEIYAYGLRNPFRYSIDRSTKKIWLGDVGQNAIEEIDIIRSGGNYGWNTMEGSQCYPDPGCNKTGLILPVAEYDHSVGASIIGGYVYRGTRQTPLSGLYLFADFISGEVFALRSNKTNLPENTLFSTELNFSAFGEDQAGELYLLSYGEGKIYSLKQR